MEDDVLGGIEIPAQRLPLARTRHDKDSITNNEVSLYEFTHGLAAKKARSKGAAEMLANEARCLQYLEKNFRSNEFVIPRLVYYRDNLLLEEKADGKTFLELDTAGAIAPKDYGRTALFLKKLHELGRTIEETPLKMFPEYDGAILTLSRYAPEGQAISEKIKSWADITAKNLNFCHGDPSPLHFFSGGETITLIDFNASRITSSALDLGAYTSNIIRHIGMRDTITKKSLKKARERVQHILERETIPEPDLINFFTATALILKLDFASTKEEKDFLLIAASRTLDLPEFDTKHLLDAIS